MCIGELYFVLPLPWHCEMGWGGHFLASPHSTSKITPGKHLLLARQIEDVQKGVLAFLEHWTSRSVQMCSNYLTNYLFKISSSITSYAVWLKSSIYTYLFIDKDTFDKVVLGLVVKIVSKQWRDLTKGKIF